MQIPRILHQTWKNNDIPENFKEMADSWRQKHIDWEYVLWTDEMNRNFIKENFAYFLPTFDGYESNIQRVDAVRYFILYKHGGFFIDMDFECLANISPLLGNSMCIFGKEPLEHCDIHKKNLIISNAFMGTTKDSPFFYLLCKELELVNSVTDHPNDKILESTGPFMLSRVYDKYDRKEEISLLEAETIYPLTKAELEEWKEDPQNPVILQKLEKAYGIHYYAGTWWKKT
jgi:mannosyltransferase OCH1-like enzyme